MGSKPGMNNRSTDRAEAARQRRTQNSQQRVNKVSNRITNPANPRPVTVRGNTFGTPILRRAGTQRARRQFYLTMDQAGSELRLPAIALTNPGWRLLSGLVAILAIFGIFSMLNSPFFRIEMVEVSGVQRLSPDDLTSTLNLENLSIIEVDRQAAFETLSRAFPELVDIQVAVFMPNIVTISATERQPVLAWQKGDEVSWVDAEGVIFPARGEAEVLVTVYSENDLPLAAPPVNILLDEEQNQAEQVEEETTSLLTAPLLTAGTRPAGQTDVPMKADPVLLHAAQLLSQKLPPETQIVYHIPNGLGWNDPHGWQVYIGKDLSEFEVKYATYQELTNYLVEQGLQPLLVSVEHLNAPFYRLEQ